jgi:DNA polymerase-3 subunit epsilon
MKYLFFDTETTGVPIDYKAPMHVVDNWPRVIQLAWALADDSQNGGKVLAKRVDLIVPDGWVVPDLPFWRQHGFSTKKCNEQGLPIAMALRAFGEQVLEADMLVAHNMNFDYNVLGAEMIRAGYSTGKRIDKFCTMQATIDFCALPGKYGYKYPKLEELHQKLFNEPPPVMHDALADVLACGRCFFELKTRGIIATTPNTV